MATTVDFRNTNELSFPADTKSLFVVGKNGVSVQRGYEGYTNLLNTVSVVPTSPAVWNGSGEATDWDTSTIGSVEVSSVNDSQEIILTPSSSIIVKKLMLDMLVSIDDTLNGIEVYLSQDGTNFEYRVNEIDAEGNPVSIEGDQLILYTQRPEGFPTAKIKIIAHGTTQNALKTVFREIQVYGAEYYPFRYLQSDGTVKYLYADQAGSFRGMDIDSISVVTAAAVSTEQMKYRFIINDKYYYHDGTEWVQVNNHKETWLEQSNTIAELQALITGGGSLGLPTGSQVTYIRLGLLWETLPASSPGITSVSVTTTDS